MKKNLLLAGLAVGLMMFGGVGVAGATILFQDNFNSGVMSSDWMSVQGSQWVQDGKLYSQDINGWPRDSQALVHDGDKTWTNYIVSMQVDPIESWVTDSTILFRTDGFDRSSTGTHGSAYQLILSNADQQASLSLYRTTNGVWTSLYNNLFSIPNGPMNIDVSANGSNIKVWVDGSLNIDIVDSNPLLYGGIGVHNIWESKGSYDDVVVSSTATPVPGAVWLFGSGLAGLVGLRKRKES